MEDDGAVSEERNSGTIALDLAFRWIVGCLEEAESMAAEERRGLKPGDLVPESGPPPISATGSRFRARFTWAPMTVRKGQERPSPIPAIVPVVPDAHKLVVLLEDHESDPEATSLAERHICQAHLWLMANLSNGLLQAWADSYIERPDATVVWVARSSIGAAFWAACSVDYEASEARSGHNDWIGCVGHYKYEGCLILRDIVIGKAGIRRQVIGIGAAKADAAPGVQAGLRMVTEDAAEPWVISWKGADCAIPTGGSARLSRGMRAIALLIRHEGERISNYLLDGLARKSGHGSVTASQKIARLDGIQKAIDPISAELFDQSIDAAEAHRRLLVVLKELKCESDNIDQCATWSAGFTGKDGKLSPDGRRVWDNVRRSREAAIKLMKDNQSEVGGEIGTFLEGAIKSDSYSCWYDGKKAPVSWSVDTGTPQSPAAVADSPSPPQAEAPIGVDKREGGQ